MFQLEDATAGPWLEKGRTIVTNAFKEQMQTIVQKVQEAGAEKASALWEDTGAELSNKALGGVAGHIKSCQERLKPTAEGMRTAANTTATRLAPLLEKARTIMDKVASLDINGFIMGQLDRVSEVVKDQLEELFDLDEIDLSTITDPQDIGIALDHVVAAATAAAARVGRWNGALQALARGFEGNAWEVMSTMLSAAADEGLTSSIKDVAKTLKSVVTYVVDSGVLNAVKQHAVVVEEKLGDLKLKLDASNDPLKELDKIEGEVNATLFQGQIKVGSTTINFKGLKDHLMAVVCEQIDAAMGEAKAKLGALMDDTIGDELKAFKRCVRRIRTQIMSLQDALAMTVESVLQAADVMDSEMYDAAEDVLRAIGQARKAASSVEKKTVYSKVKGSVSSSVSRVSRANPFKRKKKQGDATEEKVKEVEEGAVAEEENGADVSAAKEKFKQCEEKLEVQTRVVLDSLDQVKF